MPGFSIRIDGRGLFAAALVATALFALLPYQHLSAQNAGAVFSARDLFPIVSTSSHGTQAPAGTDIVVLEARASSLAAVRQARALRLTDFPLPGGATAELALESFSIFDEKSVVYAMGPDGPIRRPIPDITLYRGRVAGELGSWVYLAIEPNGMSGTIITGGKSHTVFTALNQSLAPGAPARVTVAETSDESSTYGCGVNDNDEFEQLGSALPPTPKRAVAGRDTLLAQIAIDADYESFQHYKGVANTENYIVARMGESSAIYERDLDIVLRIPFLRVWTVKDPFPGTSDRELLNVFTTYWRDKMDTVARTLAVMISRKPISAGGVSQGLAWLHVLCSTERGTAFVKFSAMDNFISGHVGVLAHEIGHNFGSPHTHSCTWNPPVDSCYTAEPIGNRAPCFTAGEIHLLLGGGELMSYCHMRYGGANKHNIYRDRVGSAVRGWAEAAPCMEATASIRMLKLTGPAGGNALCTGDSLVVTWDATGTNDFNIELSRNDGATYDTVLAAAVPRTVRRWVWYIPGGFVTGTGFRIRVKDVKNETLVDQMTASVEIKRGPTIVNQVTWRNVCEGEGVSFDVTAAGSGTLRYQWRKNGQDIPGETQPGITLQNMRAADDSSLFTCVVYGDCGSVESRPALLRVLTLPIITRQPWADTVCVGGRAVIRIEVKGTDLTYKWWELPGGKIYDVNKPEFVIDNITDPKSYRCEISSPCSAVPKVYSSYCMPVVVQPGVTVIAPKQGEVLTAGSSYDTQWRAFCSNDVVVEVSLDNGATWTELSLSTPASNKRYTWQVPETETTTGKFRVTDAANGTYTGLSGTFTIRKRPKSAFSSTEVNFGLVGTGTTATKDITLTNAGLGIMTLQSVTLYGSPEVTVNAGTLPITIQAGGTNTLSFAWTPKDVGPLTGYAVVAHNGTPARDTLPFVGDAFFVTSTKPLSSPDGLALSAAFPNPVSHSHPRVVFAFDLPEARSVKLAVYSLLGTEIRTIVSDYRAAGRHETSFDASTLVPGTYFVRLTSGADTRTRVLHVLK